MVVQLILRILMFKYKLAHTHCSPHDDLFVLRRFALVFQASFRPEKFVYEDVDLGEMDVEKELGGYPLAVLTLTYTDKSVPT